MVVEPPVLTVFSLPRAFAGHSAVIQRNAIASWLRLPNVEVILLGEEEGLADTARTLGARHELKIGRNRHGTPMVSDAFARIRGLARSPYLAFVNADIILTRDFTRALEVLFHAPFQNWLAVGQRYDLDQHEPIGDAPDWESALRRDVAVRGILHGKAGLDYFLFPKDLPIVLPPLAVGRPGWDSWLMYAVRHAGFPLVDLTAAVTAIHQNHPPAYTSNGPEAIENRRAAGGTYRMGTLRDADWRLSRAPDGRLALKRRLMGTLWFAAPVRAGLALKRY
jgi:plasmid maintenance system antidote protein VapI